MKENKTIKTIAIAVISILIIAIIGLGIYTVFIKNDDNEIIDNNIIFTSLKIEEEGEYYNHKYITNYFTLTTGYGQCDEYLKEAIDNKGNKIELIDHYYQFHDLQIENGKLIAYGTSDCPCDSEYQNCQVETKVELIYNGKSIEIKKAE